MNALMVFLENEFWLQFYFPVNTYVLTNRRNSTKRLCHTIWPPFLHHLIPIAQFGNHGKNWHVCLNVSRELDSWAFNSDFYNPDSGLTAEVSNVRHMLPWKPGQAVTRPWPLAPDSLPRFVPVPRTRGLCAVTRLVPPGHPASPPPVTRFAPPVTRLAAPVIPPVPWAPGAPCRETR